MFDPVLFYGLRVDKELEQALNDADPALRHLFLHDRENAYLSQVSVEDVRYVGKYVGEITEVGALVLLQDNLSSLFKKLIPHYRCERQSLLLFATFPLT